MILKTESAPVVIRFTIGDYTDALHFANQAERDQYSDAQIEAMCQARYDNWLAVINAPRPEPTPEEIQAQIDALTAQQRATQNQILALAPTDVALPILEAQAEIIAGQIAALTGQV
jgi:hypothetical protein